jgi:ABC-2 type transport system ATP-binding protein
MEEAERLCDRIVIIDHGKIIANDTVRGLYRSVPASHLVEMQLEGVPLNSALPTALASVAKVRSATLDERGLRIEMDDFDTTLARVLERIAAAGARVISLRSQQPSLEDVFITLTGHGLRDGPAVNA